MRRALLSIAMLAAVAGCATALTVAEVSGCLRGIPCYRAEVDYQVLMSLQDDVTFVIALEAVANPGDTLAPCDYLVEWGAPVAADSARVVSGFAAYSDGNAYLFRGDRLIEYNFADDPAVFSVTRQGGVARRAQFASLLPAFIADEIDSWVDDPNWVVSVANDTVVDGRNVVAVGGVMSRDGDVGREVMYLFQPVTMLPLAARIESNPGALAEQTILADYRYDAESEECEAIDETLLRNRYPTQFDTLRDSDFAITSLVGRALPQFALPTPTAERYTHHRGDGFRLTTLVVLLEAAGQFTPQIVEAVRDAVDVLPFNTDIVWAFTANNADEIDAVVERQRPGEHVVMGAQGLARDCGATLLPTVLFVGRDGVVADFHQGFNNTVKDIVIEKTTAVGR